MTSAAHLTITILTPVVLFLLTRAVNTARDRDRPSHGHIHSADGTILDVRFIPNDADPDVFTVVTTDGDPATLRAGDHVCSNITPQPHQRFLIGGRDPQQ